MKRLLILVITFLLFCSTAQATTITLDFNSLPSNQGWTYKSGVGGGFFDPTPSEIPEDSVFSVDGNKLIQNTMGTGEDSFSYRYFDIIDVNLPYTISITARVLDFETTKPGAPTSGFAFGGFEGLFRSVISLNTEQIGFPPFVWDFDTTQFHDYRLETMPGVNYALYIDNSLFASGSLALDNIPNHLVLGNASSFENALGEITKYTFSQPAPVPEPSTISIDIKPESCPNPLNVKSKGVLPVAILGTADLDVTDIDITSLRLNGVAPVRSGFEDVAATPTTGLEPCECLALSGDGTDDLVLKFDTQAIVAVLGIVQNGQEIPLMLTGMLLDGTEIEGSDCVVIKGVK